MRLPIAGTILWQSDKRARILVNILLCQLQARFYKPSHEDDPKSEPAMH
jgi:hypothetical protein